jgi:hypothetical protein
VLLLSVVLRSVSVVVAPSHLPSCGVDPSAASVSSVQHYLHPWWVGWGDQCVRHLCCVEAEQWLFLFLFLFLVLVLGQPLVSVGLSAFLSVSSSHRHHWHRPRRIPLYPPQQQQ